VPLVFVPTWQENYSEAAYFKLVTTYVSYAHSLC